MSYAFKVSGITLTSPFQPTEEQTKVLNSLISFLHAQVVPTKQESFLMTLTGPGGSGKTGLLKLLIQYNNRIMHRRSIMGCTLTHKSRKVLDHTINKNALLKVPTITVSALLKKVKLAGFVGTKKYQGKGTVMGDHDMIIIDEVSMVCDKDFNQIIQWAQTYGTKILFVGDIMQIPHPTQQYIEYEGKLEKKDSEAFRLVNRAYLEKVMRQIDSNPILDICTMIRRDLRKEGEVFPHISAHNQLGYGVTFLTDPAEFAQAIRKVFTSSDRERVFKSKIIVYTNQAVEQYNHLVRNFRDACRQLGGTNTNQEISDYELAELAHKKKDDKNKEDDDFKLNRYKPLISGDILLGYENLGWPQPWIENGQDYEVLSVRPVTDHAILDSAKINTGAYADLSAVKNKLGLAQNKSIGNGNILGTAKGNMVVMREMLRGADSESIPGKSTTVFFPDIYDEDNYEILQHLVKKSDKVNKYGSTIEDFKDYQHLKEQMLFMDSLYKIGSEIMGEVDFRRRHPLLSTKVTDLIQEEFIKDEKGNHKGSKRILNNENKLYEEIQSKYPDLIKNRAKDVNVLGDSEELRDIFKILNHDLRYGFSITSHKAQSSTYHTVFIDETDFDKISDRWNYKLNMSIRGTKERNQLKYVAYSRASHNVVVLHCPKNL